MITFRYSLTPQDFANFTVYVQLEAPGKKKMLTKRLLRPIFLVVILIGLINMTTSFIGDNFNIADIIPLFIFLALMLIPVFTLKARLKKAALKVAGNPENAAIFNMADYTFSETGIWYKDTSKEIKYQWNAFIKKQETAGYIYLFLHSTNALIIPKNIFRSQVEKEQLEKLLSQYISFDAEVGHLVKD